MIATTIRSSRSVKPKERRPDSLPVAAGTFEVAANQGWPANPRRNTGGGAAAAAESTEGSKPRKRLPSWDDVLFGPARESR